MVEKCRTGYSGYRQKITVGYLIMLTLLSLACFSMLYPFVNLLFQSFSKASDIIESNGLMLYPKTLQLDAYEYMLRYPFLMQSYRNTVLITIGGVAISMMLTTLGAYVLSRLDLPGRQLLTTFVVVTMFFFWWHDTNLSEPEKHATA